MYLVRGRSRELAVVGIINSMLIVIGLALGLYSGGTIGTAIGYSVTIALIFLPTMYLVVHRLLESQTLPFLRAIAVPLLLAALVGGAAALVKWLMTGRAALPVFGACVVVCTVVWLAGIRVMDRTWLRSGLGVLPTRIQHVVNRLL